MTDQTDERILAGRRLMQALLTEQSTGDDAAVFKLIAGTPVNIEGVMTLAAALKLSVFFIDWLLRLAFPDDDIRDRVRQDWFANLEGMSG